MQMLSPCTASQDAMSVPEVVTGKFVAAMYMGKWYVGKVVDLDDSDAEICFMKLKNVCISGRGNQIKYGSQRKISSVLTVTSRSLCLRQRVVGCLNWTKMTRLTFKNVIDNGFI